ncbi:sensor histidine kinase [Virgibacillus sp. DJP39]|uniref:sensor histidine kinase n=1 Tax=Virgibacillus sp. DJP39 TaxID=3409790 RepID=UPI003BB54390
MEQSNNHAGACLIESYELEAKQIALELHENISQNLYSIHMGLEYLQTGIENEHFKHYAKEMTLLMSNTIKDVRLLSGRLYPITLPTLGLNSALKSYVKSFSITFGIKVHVKSMGEECEVPELVSLAIYRSCVEALLNTAKHADVGETALHFTWEEKSLTIDIIDTGKGFNVSRSMENNPFKGIAAMKQRVKVAGGSCLISSIEGEGTKVSLVLPIRVRGMLEG